MGVAVCFIQSFTLGSILAWNSLCSTDWAQSISPGSAASVWAAEPSLFTFEMKSSSAVQAGLKLSIPFPHLPRAGTTGASLRTARIRSFLVLETEDFWFFWMSRQLISFQVRHIEGQICYRYWGFEFIFSYQLAAERHDIGYGAYILSHGSCLAGKKRLVLVFVQKFVKVFKYIHEFN